LDWVCDSQGGVWQGADTDCNDVNCPTAAEGACCIDDDCSMYTQIDCAKNQGTYYGDLTDCFDIDCFDAPEAGACCLPDGSCSFTTESICDDLKGSFNGVDTLCDEVTCGGVGACCMIDGTCQQLTEADCFMFGFEWNGPDSLCSEVECIAPIGRCCLPFEQCAVVTISVCFNELNGIFWSTFGDCLTPCPPSGACCYNGFCGVQAEGICVDSFGGVYSGDETSCADLNGDGQPDACDACRADIAPPTSGDGVVNVADLLAVINGWGACSPQPALCPADIAPPSGNGIVNVTDLLATINAWGSCGFLK
jgi:hypothetical protein